MVVLITEPDDLLSVRWDKLGEKPKTGSAFGISLGETETEALASAKKALTAAEGPTKALLISADFSPLRYVPRFIGSVCPKICDNTVSSGFGSKSRLRFRSRLLCGWKTPV